MDKYLFDRPSKFGLVAGDGEYPLILAAEALQFGSEVITFAFNNITSPQINAVSSKVYWNDFGQIEPLIQGFSQHGITQAIFAGRIRHTVVLDTQKFDPFVKSALKKLPNQQADTLIGAATKAFGVFGVNFLDARTFMDNHLASDGPMTHLVPNDERFKDIEFGYQLAKHIGEKDIGQTVVVKNRTVLAVESIEGTDLTIKRALSFAGNGITIVKVSKPRQDFRYDIPVIGESTLKTLSSTEDVVLAVESKNTLILNKQNVIAEADCMNLCIYGVKP